MKIVVDIQRPSAHLERTINFTRSPREKPSSWPLEFNKTFFFSGPFA